MDSKTDLSQSSLLVAPDNLHLPFKTQETSTVHLETQYPCLSLDIGQGEFSMFQMDPGDKDYPTILIPELLAPSTFRTLLATFNTT